MYRRTFVVLKKAASLQNTVLLGLLLLVIALFILPEATRQIKQCSPGKPLIDHLVLFQPSEVYNTISAYDKRGRSLYVAVELTADLVLWIVAAAFLCSLLIWSASKISNNTMGIKYLVFLPCSLMVINALENGCIIWMLLNFRQPLYFLIGLTAFLALLKWLLTLVCLSIVAFQLFRICTVQFHLLQQRLFKEAD